MQNTIQIPFTKLHGLGNDFVLIDLRATIASQVKLSQQIIHSIADRKRGVGFDQLLVLKPSTRVHAVLEIYNADGSLAEMCGNGLRAAALYIWNRSESKDPKLVFETCAGDRSAKVLGPDGFIECEMGVPKVKAPPKILKSGVRLGKRKLPVTVVNVGNPHAVFFEYPKKQKQVVQWGGMVENHRAFPKRTNVEFVKVVDAHVLKVQVWERGVGLTEACGTGAVAAAAAAIANGSAHSPVEVCFPGGAVEVRWEKKSESAYLRGYAHEVFTGTWLSSD